MQQSDDHKFIPMTSVSAGKGHEVRDDVYYYTDQIVNIVLLGKPGNNNFLLIDAGMPGSGEEIISVVEGRFGKGSKPAAIVLTHGHFDHVGSIVALIRHWQVPVYAHPLEFPFLTGKQSYPEPDVTVEGGLLAKLSFLYPHEPIDIHEALLPIPQDNTLLHFEDWKWIHTPGHSPGHISFFRASDKTLIAGDAFVTVRQDSMYKVLFQKKEVNGPPRYLTTDWNSAWESVRKLEALNPALAVTGHGTFMEGDELRSGLTHLANMFKSLAIPAYGKYVDKPSESL